MIIRITTTSNEVFNLMNKTSSDMNHFDELLKNKSDISISDESRIVALIPYHAISSIKVSK